MSHEERQRLSDIKNKWWFEGELDRDDILFLFRLLERAEGDLLLEKQGAP